MASSTPTRWSRCLSILGSYHKCRYSFYPKAFLRVPRVPLSLNSLVCFLVRDFFASHQSVLFGYGPQKICDFNYSETLARYTPPLNLLGNPFLCMLMMMMGLALNETRGEVLPPPQLSPPDPIGLDESCNRVLQCS